MLYYILLITVILQTICHMFFYDEKIQIYIYLLRVASVPTEYRGPL